MVVARAFCVNLHAAAELADMLMERRLEPAIAEAATMKPLRRERLPGLDDLACIDVRGAEGFKWPCRATSFRERRALDHHRARVGARHPEVRRVGAGIDPGALAQRPAESRRRVGLPILHLD